MRTLPVLLLPLLLSACLLETVGPIDRSSKPYGAHWVKDGMTRESRREDFVDCGGSADMKEGLPYRSSRTTTEFFKEYNDHVFKVVSCMRSKGYDYQQDCDERCLHP